VHVERFDVNHIGLPTPHRSKDTEPFRAPMVGQHVRAFIRGSPWETVVVKSADQIGPGMPDSNHLVSRSIPGSAFAVVLVGEIAGRCHRPGPPNPRGPLLCLPRALNVPFSLTPCHADVYAALSCVATRRRVSNSSFCKPHHPDGRKTQSPPAEATPPSGEVRMHEITSLVQTFTT
jgi:hypothetical protein